MVGRYYSANSYIITDLYISTNTTISGVTSVAIATGSSVWNDGVVNKGTGTLTTTGSWGGNAIN